MSRDDDSKADLARENRGGACFRSSVHQALLSKIDSAAVRVGIIGLGYVGLPLARAFSEREIAVLGFDLDAAKVARLDRGESYIEHISAATIREDAGKSIRGYRRLQPAR